MPRSTCFLGSCLIAVAMVALSSCGGGGGSQSLPPPQTGSFTLGLDPTSVGMAQGSGQPLNVTIRPQNGFTGSVMVTASGLASGVTVSPSSLVVSSGATGTLQFNASSNAATGTSQVTIQGVTGTLNSQIIVPVTVDSVAKPISRPFVTTGGSPERAFYDETRNLLFVTNPSLNEVEVFSGTGTNFSIQSRVHIPQPFGIDQMADGNTLVVGTLTQAIYTLDETTLTVTPHLSPNFSQSASTTTLLVTPAAMANGKVLVIGQDEGISSNFIFGGQHLIEWNSVTNSFAEPTLSGPLQITSNEFDSVKRSADHKWAIMSSGNLYLYSSDADSFTAVAAPNDVRDVAANPNGTQFAVVGAFTVTFFDRALNTVGAVTTTSGIFEHTNTLYSSDGTRLFWELFGGPTATAANASIVDVLDAVHFTEIGDVTASYNEAQIEPTLLWVDSTSRAFLSANAGVGTADCTILRQGPPTNDASGIPFPTGLPLGSTAPVLFNLAAPPFGTVITFGGVLGTIQSASSANTAITVLPPVSNVPGPVETVFSLPDGEAYARPMGFSYGLSLATPTATLLPPTGNPIIGIFGFGMQDDPFTPPAVTIGGQSATNPQINSSGGVLEEVAFNVPAGSPGPADITAKSSLGSDTLSGSVSYIPSATIIPAGGLLQLLYDSKRNLVYALTSTQIDVFNPSTSAFQSPIIPGGSGGTHYVAMALTPDGSRLLIVDSTANTLTIVNPDNQAQVTVAALPSQPFGVVPTNTNKVFIDGSERPIEFDLSTMTATQRSDDFPNLAGQFVGTPDGSHIAVAVLGSSAGTVSVWNSSNDSFTSQGFIEGFWTDIAISPDGTTFVALLGDPASAGVFAAFFDEQLHYLNSNVYPDLAPPDAPQCLGSRFTASGKTLVNPLEDSIDFIDVQSGTLRGRLLTPQPLQVLSFPITSSGILAIDSAEQSIFVISASGLTVLKLAQSIDAITPAAWPFSVRAKPFEGTAAAIRARASVSASR